MIKVCHMTSAHGTEDVRIFHKECVSLANAGYEVYEVARGESYDKNGVHIVGVGDIPKSRRKRMTEGAKRVYQKALELDCDIYHFHDPELLPYGLKLKKHGKKVIFDSHEELPAQIMEKGWIPKYLRPLVSKLAITYELLVTSKIDAVVSATPHIKNIFENKCSKVCAICNYPILSEICMFETTFGSRERILCYTGSHIQPGLIENMSRAIENIDATFVVAGDHKVEENGKIKFVGRLSRPEISKLYSQSMIGIQLGKKTPNGERSLPIKIFEYMAAGLPSIIKDYEYFKETFENKGISICVNPENVDEIANAIRYLLDNPEEARRMGENGRRAVEQEFNWGVEEKKLLKLYEELAAKT